MDLVFRLPQGLATSCPRALRPGTIPPMNQPYRDGNDFLLPLKEFSRIMDLNADLNIQPGRKHRRRQARLSKAAAVAPRPVDKLRPVVRCPTIKYNRRSRAGRGFTLQELKVSLSVTRPVLDCFFFPFFLCRGVFFR